MAIWSSRSSGYKLGVLVLFLGSVFYVIGYASPFWLQGSSSSGTGLWMACYELSGHIKCVSSTGSEVSWFKAVQAMQTIGLIALFFSCLLAFVFNCCQTNASHNRAVELLAGFAGLCGFIGCMVFVGETQASVSLSYLYYGWAFGLNLTGCILVMITAAIIFATNRPDLASASTAGVVTYSGGVPIQGVSTVVMSQGQVYPPPGQGYPVQPGAGYVIQPGYGYPQGYSGAAQYPGGSAPMAPPPQAGYPSPNYSAYGYDQGYSGQAGVQEQK